MTLFLKIAYKTRFYTLNTNCSSKDQKYLKDRNNYFNFIMIILLSFKLHLSIYMENQNNTTVYYQYLYNHFILYLEERIFGLNE